MGFGLVYGLDGVSFAIAFGSVALLPPLRPAHGGPPISLASLLGGLRYLRGSQPLAAVLVIDLGPWCSGCRGHCSRRWPIPCSVGARPPPVT